MTPCLHVKGSVSTNSEWSVECHGFQGAPRSGGDGSPNRKQFVEWLCIGRELGNPMPIVVCKNKLLPCSL